MKLPDDFDIRKFHRIVFFTGAGLSADSGIPTYRGKGGIWHKYNYEDYACQDAFDRNPEHVWDFHDERRKFIAARNPSRGHEIIAEIEREFPDTTVVTQNIDGLHQRAGTRNIIELHGSIWRVRCSREGTVSENFEVPIASRKCTCGAYLRPDIVWFGDPLRETDINRAIDAIARCDLFISIGTSGVVYPAAHLPLYAVKRRVPTIEINIADSEVSQIYTFHMRGSASEMLEKLWHHSM